MKSNGAVLIIAQEVLAMTNLKDFVEKEAIDLGGFDKFPQGDTFIDLEKTEVVKEDSPFKDKAGNLKPQYRLTTPTLKNLMCPVGVMAEIQKLATEGYKEVRITRTGTTKENTNYTVVGTKKWKNKWVSCPLQKNTSG